MIATIPVRNTKDMFIIDSFDALARCAVMIEAVEKASRDLSWHGACTELCDKHSENTENTNIRAVN